MNILCSLQREKDGLRQKQKEVDAMASRHAKERQRIKQVQIKDFHQLSLALTSYWKFQ